MAAPRWPIIQFNPTIQLPLLGPVQQRLLKAFRSTGRDTPSHIALWAVLPDLAMELRQISKDTGIKTHLTIKAFQKDAVKGYPLLTLLWAMPADVIECLVTQTLQLELYENPRYSKLTTHGPGIYVATVGVEGRNGKFLSRREIAKVIRLMDMYTGFAQIFNRLVERTERAGWKMLRHTNSADIERYIDLALLQSLPWPDNSVNTGIGVPVPFKLTKLLRGKLDMGLDFMWSVDNQYKNKNNTWSVEVKGSRWIPLLDQDKGLDRFRRLRVQLYRRIGGKADEDDADKIDIDKLIVSKDDVNDQRQHQAPQYAGCSNKLSKRAKDYTLGNLDHINKHIGILCCLLSHAGYLPEINFNIVLRTWQNDQLGVAEQLVCLLGQCLVWQDGFNSTECGAQDGTVPAPTLVDVGLSVLGSYTIVSDSLEMASRDLVTRITHLNKSVDTGNKLDLLQRSIVDLRGRVDHATRLVQEIGGVNAPQDIRSTTLRLANQNLRLQEACITLDAACRWMDLVLNRGAVPATRFVSIPTWATIANVAKEQPDKAAIDALHDKIIQSCGHGMIEEFSPEDLQFARDFTGDISDGDSESEPGSGHHSQRGKRDELKGSQDADDKSQVRKHPAAEPDGQQSEASDEGATPKADHPANQYSESSSNSNQDDDAGGPEFNRSGFPGFPSSAGQIIVAIRSSVQSQIVVQGGFSASPTQPAPPSYELTSSEFTSSDAPNASESDFEPDEEGVSSPAQPRGRGKRSLPRR
ncbi:hypothetical protein ACHAQH_007983 [Verticillium albo-atrum]